MYRLSSIIILALFVMAAASCKKSQAETANVGEAANVSKVDGKALSVDLSNSLVNWAGSKPTGTHTGTVNLSSGEVKITNGEVVGGSFVLDMNSITCTDLEGNSKSNLEAHLKGTAEGKEDHFFNVAQFPTASFEISKVSRLENDPNASHLVYGNLTMRDVTKEVGFKANISISDGVVKVASPEFSIDRTLWGIQYMSKTVFDDLKDKFIDDNIQLSISLKAQA